MRQLPRASRARLVSGQRPAPACAFLCPGTHIPIVPEAQPDYFLVLPWHFKESILQREQEFLAAGGKMIFPFPDIDARLGIGASSHDFAYASITASGSPCMAIFPPSSQTARPQRRRTSVSACVTITIVTPRRLNSSSRS